MHDALGSALAAIATHEIRYVRFIWCDNAGVIRAKAVHRDALAGHQDLGVGIAAAQYALPAMYDALAPGAGLTPAGEVYMRADWPTLTPLPYAPGHARVLTDIYDGDAPWVHCPRAFLRRTLGRAAERGLHVEAAFEDEFYLLRREGDDLSPADRTVFGQTAALDGLAPVLDAIGEALEAQGLQVLMLHSESGPGQFELSIRHADALAAADRQVAYRETVRAVAQRHGLVASFLPKVFADRAGCGAHLHLSLWRDGRNLTSAANDPQALSAEARAFVAGLLVHLPALMTLTMPSPNSFSRIQPRFWSGAFACWGIGNREAAVRVPQPPARQPFTNVELKAVDATCNPYLALGAAIAAGLDGLARALDPGEPLQMDPADLTDAERAARDIRPLPTTLGQAIGALETDQVLLDALGLPLAQSYLAVRRAERDALHDATLDDQVRLLAERY